ncbi:MAG: beta-ribofuranosylaminobenzene 5'-phosphate synthase, partial [Methanosarcinales archaeon]|nr:beta-ribofuranosylaminobenzene 5'-phosphate synthase [Methanosarcinales archaeon]
MIEIIAPSRIHMTLIDLNASIGRVDGGIGITLQEPAMCIHAEAGDGITISGQSEHAQRMHDSAQKVSDAFGTGGVCIEVVSDYPSHTGLGSGTQASLAAAYAVCAVHGIDVPVRRLSEIVGRGGTSGIGVAAFERGGFILDGGHKFSEKGGFKPSAASVAKPAPIILQR